MQRQEWRHPTLDRDPNISCLFDAVRWPEPIGAQHKLPPEVLQPQDRRRLPDSAVGGGRQCLAKLYDDGQRLVQSLPVGCG